MAGRNRIRACFVCALIWAGSTGCSSSPQAKEAKFLRRGESRLAKKDYAGALVEFLNASQATPNDAEPYYQIGLAYLHTGNLGAGIGALRKATELNPKHAAAQLKLAELMTASQNKDLTEEAATRLQAVLLASPDNLEAIDSLALAEWHLGNTDQATKLIDESLQKFPMHLQSSVTLARLKLSRNDYVGAEDVLKKAVAKAPQSWQAAVALGQLHLLMKQPDRAEAEIRRALQLDNNNGPALLALASIQVAGNRIDEAEQTYKQLSTLPSNAFKLIYARFLYHTGKRDAALAQFQNLVKDNPDDRVIRNWLLSTYLDMNKIAEAQALLAAALKKNPADADALFHRGELYLRLGKTTEAQQDLQPVLRLVPESADAHFAMARIYKVQGQTVIERQELREALRFNERLLAARLALARNLTAANEAKSAVEILDNAPEPQKRTLALVVDRNWALLALGNTNGLRPVLNEALLRFGRSPDLLLQDAILKGKERNYAGARLNAEEVLKHDPENLRAALLLAESYAAQHRDSEAVAKLRALAAARPKSVPLQDLLAKWYMTAGNVTEARSAFEIANKMDPKFVAADIALAELDRRENHFDAARQRLMRVLTVDARNVHALLLLADVEGQAGNRSAAVAKYRSVLELDSSNLFALNNLAYLLAFNDPDEGLMFAQQAVKLAPDNATVLDTLGWVYYRRGMYSAATTSLKAALAKQPSASTQYHLAMSYLKAGNQQMGQKALLAALKQDPNLPKTEQGW
jgi:tetratricopeptide (TPR) repeat protein